MRINAMPCNIITYKITTTMGRTNRLCGASCGELSAERPRGSHGRPPTGHKTKPRHYHPTHARNP
eukprot:4603143-Pyramimonas_sp.AAC.1